MVSHSDDQAAKGNKNLGQDESDHSLEPQQSQEPEELVSKFCFHCYDSGNFIGR